MHADKNIVFSEHEMFKRFADKTMHCIFRT